MSLASKMSKGKDLILCLYSFDDILDSTFVVKLMNKPSCDLKPFNQNSLDQICRILQKILHQWRSTLSMDYGALIHLILITKRYLLLNVYLACQIIVTSIMKSPKTTIETCWNFIGSLEAKELSFGCRLWRANICCNAASFVGYSTVSLLSMSSSSVFFLVSLSVSLAVEMLTWISVFSRNLIT